MNIMQIGSNSLYNISTSYTIKLNEKELLIVEDDPASKEQAEVKKLTHKKELELKKAEESKKNLTGIDDLSDDEKRLVKGLQARDSEVKTHESAHQSAGGGMVGAASYTYQQGPDGKMYAIGGEVSISTPISKNPEDAIRNAHTIIASAMAAGDPSPQDFAVASSARMMEIKAQQQKLEEAYSQDENNSSFDISA